MAKISRKELKEDEVHDLGVRMARWFVRNQTTLYFAVGVLLILLLGRMFVSSRQMAARSAMNARYGELYREYRRASTQGEQAERASSLEAALRGFADFAAAHQGRPIGRHAALLQGNILLDLERYDEARAHFAQLEKNAASAEERAEALIALGNCLENQSFRAEAPQEKKQLLAQALEQYNRAIEAAAQSYLGYYALAGKARILEREPQTRGEALRIYEKIIAERPAAQAALLAPPKIEDAQLNSPSERRMLQDLFESQSFEKLAEYRAEQLRNLE